MQGEALWLRGRFGGGALGRIRRGLIHRHAGYFSLADSTMRFFIVFGFGWNVSVGTTRRHLVCLLWHVVFARTIFHLTAWAPHVNGFFPQLHNFFMIGCVRSAPRCRPLSFFITLWYDNLRQSRRSLFAFGRGEESPDTLTVQAVINRYELTARCRKARDAISDACFRKEAGSLIPIFRLNSALGTTTRR